jgi:hypothetical protein
MTKKQTREYHTYEISISPLTVLEPYEVEATISDIIIYEPAEFSINVKPIEVVKNGCKRNKK